MWRFSRMSSLGGVLFVLAGACQSGDPPRGASLGQGRAEPDPGSVAPQGAVTATGADDSDPPSGGQRPQHEEEDGFGWGDAVEWSTYEEGLARAKAESKPMMVVVYADWCPKCRSLAPVFDRPDVAELSEDLVMVRQDHDADPAWLKPYNEKYGGYVPRIFFFDSNGKVREDVTSGHPRFPYFYAAGHVDFLKRSMRAATSS